MKKMVVFATVFAASTAVAQPDKPNPDQLVYELGQQIDQAFYRDDTTKSWVLADAAGDASGGRCKATLAALAKAGVAGSRKLELSNDNPELMKGKHAIDDVRGVCDKIDRYARIKAWEFWAFQAVQESARIGGGGYYDVVFFERCVEGYDQLIKAGVAKTQTVLERDVTGPKGPTRWAGSIEDLRKKWCDIGLKKVRAEMDAKQAPYKKALKGDKLAMVIPSGANAVRAYILPGGAVSSDAKQLAAAKVWFSDTQSVNSDRSTCKGGQEIHTIYRYQFDAAHKLVKTTEKPYCGKVPRSAYK